MIMKKTIKSPNSFLKLLILPILFLSLITACSDDDDTVNDTPDPDPELNIVELAASNDDFSILADLIVDLGLDETLTSANFTVFAPTNDAFNALPDGTIESLTEEELTSILTYHVVSGVVLSSQIQPQQDVETLQGERILLQSNAGVTVNGNATVINPDLEASNGVIHAIDEVLLPAQFRESSIIETAEAAGGFETLLGAIESAGLTTTFQFLGDFTVFAPSDEAFDALPEGLISSLTEDQLTEILSYHVLSQVVRSTDLTASQTAASLTGEPLWIEADGDVLVNGNATVTSPDIEASNGVIHAVDNVLLPDEFGTVVQNAIKRFNFEILVSAVTDAGLADALSGEGPFTVFAPTDDAFGNLPDGLLESLTIEQLSEILQYHVISADIKSGDLEEEQAVASLTGENLFVTASGGEVLVNNQSSVITADVDASNGTIHGINEVLLPNEFIDVVDIASKNFNLSTLVSLVADAGLVETLKSDGPFTIFAPVNSAFEDISETLETLTAEQVENVLTFHVVPQKILSGDLNPQQTVTTVNGEDIEVIVDGETVTVNGSAIVTTVDLEGANGVIHLIDSVLIPDNL